ncbi:MAG: hypothetical protein U0X73_17550 [Thermoanaerobaculia bacterium]
MCLFITVAPCSADFNRTQVKRVLKAASVLSAFPDERKDGSVYFLANDRHCACDLGEAAGHSQSGPILLKAAAARALSSVAQALVAAGVEPFVLRVFWAGSPEDGRHELSLSEFVALATSRTFDPEVAYVISS